MQFLQNRRPTLRLRKPVMEQLVKLLSEKGCIILADLLSKTFLNLQKISLVFTICLNILPF